MSAQERTGWRDQEISGRHRSWGASCPAVDLDFLLVEYNFGAPVAVVEYKHHYAAKPDLNHPTYRALKKMADIAKLPFLLAFYWPEKWSFRVFPVNEIAIRNFESPCEDLTERQYVQRLYRLRRLVLAKELEGKLHNVMPPAF